MRKDGTQRNKLAPGKYPSGQGQRQRTQRDRKQQDEEQFHQPRRTLEYLPGSPLIVPRDRHNISRKNIDPDALKVISRLLRSGYVAFLVGGGVRDLLLGRTPKDFDIGTDASPEEVRKLFRNSRIIGRRFRINQVYFFGNKIFEVATFRAREEPGAELETEEDTELSQEVKSLRKSDNTFGDPETDALRRDLTINGLFYDLATFSVIDYVGGILDLKERIIRIIGEPEVRIVEDPVRMIRAVRHAARTGFSIEPRTYAAICKLKHLIKDSSPPRVFEEIVRELTGGYFESSIKLMLETGLLQEILPSLAKRYAEDPRSLLAVIRNIDSHCRSGGELSVAVLFLALYMSPNRNPDLLEGLPDFWCYSPSSEQLTNARSRYAREQSVVLEREVESFFREIKVSKRERERMPKLLTARYALLEAYEGLSELGSLRQKSYFDEALLLLNLTAIDDYLQGAAEYWQSQHARSANRRRERRSPR